MRTTKFNLKAAALALFALISVFFSACSDNNPVFGPSNFEGIQADNMPNGISETVRKHQSGRGYVFDLQNNSTDTIVNDFHVIFDSTVKITGWNIGRNWNIDPNSTDTAKGKFGIKSGNNGQPIPPGQIAENLLWVELKFTGTTKKNPRQWWDFKWQATRDGTVVKEGLEAFPN